jgi:hypothetical protein
MTAMKSFIFIRIVLIILILNSLVCYTEGQIIPDKPVKSVFITGITYDSNTKEPLSNAYFKINNKNIFETNEAGRFSFYGLPGDTVVFTYMGYQPNYLVLPDTLESEEYVMGVFMHEQSIKLAEIIILPRISSKSIVITSVATDQKTMDIAQNHVNDAVVKGLTERTKVYDSDMNAKKTMRNNQMRIEYKGMLVSPENSVGLSTQSYKTYNIIYGSPIITYGRADKEMITNNESGLLLKHFEIANNYLIMPQPANIDTIAPK